MNVLGIFGTSGFAREVGDVAVVLGFDPVFIAQDRKELARWAFDSEIITENEVDRYQNASFIVGVGDNRIRERIARRYSERLNFTNLIHPSATFGRGQREAIDSRCGVVVCAGVRFTNNIRVGDFCIFNLNVTVGHDVLIENFVNLAPGANISGNVHLKRRTWVGSGATVNQGTDESKLCIGADTVVGSGAVVIQSCEPRAVYAGVPAKRIR